MLVIMYSKSRAKESEGRGSWYFMCKDQGRPPFEQRLEEVKEQTRWMSGLFSGKGDSTSRSGDFSKDGSSIGASK